MLSASSGCGGMLDFSRRGDKFASSGGRGTFDSLE